MIELLWLFFLAIPIGAWAVFLGASMFLSLPLFQVLFPQMSLAFWIANIKVGSLFRNGVAVFAAREKLDVKKAMIVTVPVVIGSIVGAQFAVSFPQIFVIPIIVVAILLTEFSATFQRFMTGRVFLIAAFLVGVYGGIFGAGVSLFIWALLKSKTVKDFDLANVRTDGLFIEGLLTLSAVLVFFFNGQINWPVALVWSAGSMIGGFFGGKIIKVSGKWESSTQVWLLRLSFVVALGVSVVKVLS
jgi:uncharacterized protein